MLELWHACANEVPPLSVLQVSNHPTRWTNITIVHTAGTSNQRNHKIQVGENKFKQISIWGEMCKTPGFNFEKVICSISRKCIYVLDHHCFFLGRCVGRLLHNITLWSMPYIICEAWHILLLLHIIILWSLTWHLYFKSYFEAWHNIYLKLGMVMQYNVVKRDITYI